jgi:hypothetical protein
VGQTVPRRLRQPVPRHRTAVRALDRVTLLCVSSINRLPG